MMTAEQLAEIKPLANAVLNDPTPEAVAAFRAALVAFGTNNDELAAVDADLGSARFIAMSYSN